MLPAAAAEPAARPRRPADDGADTRGDARRGAARAAGRGPARTARAGDVRGPGRPGRRAPRPASSPTLRANVRSLGITDLSMRYVDEDGGRVTDDQQRSFGDRAWVADVQLAWRVRGFDTARRAAARSPLTLRRDPARAPRSSPPGRTAASATPLWLLDRRRRTPARAGPWWRSPATATPTRFSAPRRPGGRGRAQGAARLARTAGRGGARATSSELGRVLGADAGRVRRDRRRDHDRRRLGVPGRAGAHLREPAGLRPARAPRARRS